MAGNDDGDGGASSLRCLRGRVHAACGYALCRAFLEEGIAEGRAASARCGGECTVSDPVLAKGSALEEFVSISSQHGTKRSLPATTTGGRGDPTLAGDGRRRGELPARRRGPRLCGREYRQVLHHLVNPHTHELKICDFGSAKVLVNGEPSISYICSRYYRAPELIFGATEYTTAIGLWSTGCVMAELLLGQPVFPGESGVDQLVEIIKCEIQAASPLQVNSPGISASPLQCHDS